MGNRVLRETIKLVSPRSWREFNAKWTGGTRDFSKRLAVYEYADVDGADIDDFGVGPDRYPISLIFDGFGYVNEAEDFIQACKEKGPWAVTHPTKGLLALQLVSLSEQDQPVSNANSITINTDWLEAIVQQKQKTATQMKKNTEKELRKLNFEQAERFQRAKLDTFSDRTKLTDMVEGMAKGIDKVLGPIATVNSQVAQKMRSVQRDLQNVIAIGITDPLKVAGLIQQTIQIPMLAVTDLHSRLKANWALAQNIFDQKDFWDARADDSEGFNRAALDELGLLSVLANMSTLSITSDVQTKADAIKLIEDMEAMKASVAEHLGISQKGLENALIENQYFMQEGSYNTMIQMISSSKEFLITTAMELKVAKWVVLTKDTSPFQLVVEYYGDARAGQYEDSTMSFFLETNGLKGDNVMLIPAGTRVVFYV